MTLYSTKNHQTTFETVATLTNKHQRNNLILSQSLNNEQQSYFDAKITSVHQCKAKQAQKVNKRKILTSHIMHQDRNLIFTKQQR